MSPKNFDTVYNLGEGTRPFLFPVHDPQKLRPSIIFFASFRFPQFHYLRCITFHNHGMKDDNHSINNDNRSINDDNRSINDDNRSMKNDNRSMNHDNRCMNEDNRCMNRDNQK